MNPEGGYTRQYRRLWEHPAFRNKQEAAVFSWMIAAAQWREARISTKFGPVALGVGELLIAERELADDFGLHRNTVRALIQRMLDEGIIERFLDRCPHRAGTIVRIVNYALYQGLEALSGSKEDRSGTDDGTIAGPKEDRRGTKNKEENQGKEVNRGVVGTRAGATSAAKGIIRAFDNARANAYGEHHRRPHPQAKDLVFAQRWLDAGADPDLCEAVFVQVCGDMAERSQAPPAALAFFDQRVADAIATRNRPMPEGTPHEQHRQAPRQPRRNAWAVAAERHAEGRVGTADGARDG